MTYNHKFIEACAQAAHEANRAYCYAMGDTSQLSWNWAPDWQRESVRAGVKGALEGNTSEECHAAWLEHKLADGWSYGPEKNAETKKHPCMIAYAKLPPEQQAKDRLFLDTVMSMAEALEAAGLDEDEDEYLSRLSSGGRAPVL